MSLKIFQMLLPLFAQPFCGFCFRYLDEYQPLCGQCLDSIKPMASQKILLFNKNVVTVCLIGTYEDPLRYLVNARQREYAYRLALLLVRFFGAYLQGHERLVPLRESPHDMLLTYYVGKLTGSVVVLDNEEQLTSQEVVLIGAVFSQRAATIERVMLNRPATVRVFALCSSRLGKK